MRRIKLDKIDRKILNDLQNEGRMTNVELAKRVGISAPPCLRRVRALEDANYIESYHAYINQKLMGYDVTVYAEIKLKSQSEKDLKAFEKACRDHEEIRECHLLYGDADFLLKIVAQDWEKYEQFLSSTLANGDNVSSIKTMPLVRTTKKLPGVPIDVN